MACPVYKNEPIFRSNFFGFNNIMSDKILEKLKNTIVWEFDNILFLNNYLEEISRSRKKNKKEIKEKICEDNEVRNFRGYTES